VASRSREVGPRCSRQCPPHPAQLLAEHPEQPLATDDVKEDFPVDETLFTPKTENSRLLLCPPHVGQVMSVDFPMTRTSNLAWQSSHLYS